ncbi:MAG: EAL domain-containing protein [Rhodocyclaceae bacterium]|nr:EAL domain-containing protein [Rhodocyclaceae bacterium]MDZ4214508.1 EAL domain-containing protein [Rhodocyclaceae bacterium]
MTAAPDKGFVFFRSLRARLLFAMLLIEAVMLVILVANSVRLIQQHMIRQAESRIAAIELAYKTALAAPLASRDYATLRDILEGWLSAKDVLYIAVADRAGKPLVSLGWPAERSLPAPTAPAAGGDTIHVAFDVDYQGMLYGRVHYGLSSAFIEEARQALFEQSILIAMLELSLSFLLLLATGYWLTRDFMKLTVASQRVADGDFGSRVALHGNDEVAAVGRSFNAMAMAVEARMSELKEGERRFRAIADYTYAWENWFGPDGKLRWINPAVERMTGYSVRDCMLMINFPQPLVHAPDRHLVAHQHQMALAGETGQDLEFRVETRDGRVVWMALSWQPIFAEDGESLGYRSSVRDITVQHFAHEELAYAASHDTLTGLYNRRAFEMELARELDVRLPGKVIVFYIDLDQFKLVNDTSGHTAGDSLLQHLARVMQARFSFGFLARLGGDEFGMVLCDMTIEEAERRAQHVIDDIRSLPFVWEERTFRIGASIGIAQSSMELRTITDLLMAADTACYAAKERGRNRAQVYLPTDQYFQQRQLDFMSLSQISDALGAGRMELHAQRIVSLKPDLPDYAEVLVRMKSEDGDLIQPGRFIPAAERYGLIPLIDRWVIEHSLIQLRDWRQAGKPLFKLNVNLSGLTLADHGLAEFIEHMTERYGTNPATLGFEITESCAIAQLDQALGFFDFCQKKGFSLALDDFGSGLSSFGYLKRFKVQTLKIDGMFVRNVDYDLDDRAVVDSMVRLAQLRKLKTVAEFVTSPDVLTVVKALDVDYAQGYALHIPEPLANLMP